MKKIIKSVDCSTEISVEQLVDNRKIVAYRSSKSPNIRILANLTPEKPVKQNQYGFVPLGYIAHPSFVSDSWHGSVMACVNSRQLYLFENQSDLIDAIHDGKI